MNPADEMAAKIEPTKRRSAGDEGSQEFKLEAVRLIRDRGVSYAQASQDLNVHPTQLRNWVKEFADDSQDAFPGHGRLKPEQLDPFGSPTMVMKMQRTVRSKTKRSERMISQIGVGGDFV